MSNFFYLVKQGFKNVFQNRMMSFSCIGVLVACMMLIGSAVLFSLSVNNLLDDVDSQSQVVIYLENKTSPEKIEQELGKIDNIIEAEFISKEDLLKHQRERFGNEASLLNGLEGKENPLPDSFVIRVENTEFMEQTVKELQAIKGIEKVNAPIEVARILSGIKQSVYYAGVGIVAILIVVSLAIITNTIKITIFSRRREINIMKYVGATDGFIRLPFLVEGIVIGLSAALIAFLLLGIGYPYLMHWSYENYGAALGVIFNNAAKFQDVATMLLGGFVAIGVSIAVLSSTVFVRKHLRV